MECIFAVVSTRFTGALANGARAHIQDMECMRPGWPAYEAARQSARAWSVVFTAEGRIGLTLFQSWRGRCFDPWGEPSVGGGLFVGDGGDGPIHYVLRSQI